MMERMIRSAERSFAVRTARCPRYGDFAAVALLPFVPLAHTVDGSDRPDRYPRLHRHHFCPSALTWRLSAITPGSVRNRNMIDVALDKSDKELSMSRTMTMTAAVALGRGSPSPKWRPSGIDDPHAVLE